MASITDSIKKLIKKIFGSSTQRNIPGIPKQQANRPPLNTLQQYLDKIYPTLRVELGPDFGTKTQVPISIYLKGVPNHNDIYAGIYDTEFHFSGSLLKVAAMFAAFKLRAKARSLIDDIRIGNVQIANQTNFLNVLESRLNLNTALPVITNTTGITKKPDFLQILKITGNFNQPSSLNADFDDRPAIGFAHHMERMIIPSDNCSAGECIIRLSYAYINVVLMEDNFFDRNTINNPSPQGIWLAGDYIVTTGTHPCFNAGKKQKYVRLPTTNDCDEVSHFCGSAQGTTSKEMSRFFLKILSRDLVDPISSQEMFDLLHTGQYGVPPMRERSFLTRPTTCNEPLLFTVEGVKIGQGEIKKDSQRGPIEVRSEGIIIKWTMANEDERNKWKNDFHLTGDGSICWQNLSNQIITDGVAKIINQTIRQFINQDPLIP
jgi:hypothetical protein